MVSRWESISLSFCWAGSKSIQAVEPRGPGCGRLVAQDVLGGGLGDGGTEAAGRSLPSPLTDSHSEGVLRR